MYATHYAMHAICFHDVHMYTLVTKCFQKIKNNFQGTMSGKELRQEGKRGRGFLTEPLTYSGLKPLFCVFLYNYNVPTQ